MSLPNDILALRLLLLVLLLLFFATVTAQPAGTAGGTRIAPSMPCIPTRVPPTVPGEPMIQTQQLQQKLSQIEQVIGQAVQAVESDQAAPQELKECVKELGDQSREAQQLLKESTNGNGQQLVECIDEMEETSDRAKKACEQARNLGAQAKSSVAIAHDKLAQLKHQLH